MELIKTNNKRGNIISMAFKEQDTKQFLSDSKFYEGYSRFLTTEDRYETWNESVARVMNMHREYYKDKMTDELSTLIDKTQKAYEEKRILGAQRALQFGGDQLIKHPSRLYNCVFSIVDRPKFFGEVFFWLLCGAGAGFSVQQRHVSLLPKVLPRHKQAKTYIVEDSIEGWASSLDVLMSSFFEGGGKHDDYEHRKVYFDLSKIRPKGALISGGFKAPGPEPLRLALNKIENILISASETKRQLKSIEIYDIIMHASDAVLAGGVRRSATICLFDSFDDEMINAKTGNWFVDNPQRGRSNNSAVIIRDETPKEIFNFIFEKNKQFGEPGFIFLDNPDSGFNPCVEIGLYPFLINEDGTKTSGWQGCNLTEGNGSMCNTLEEYLEMCECLAILGTLQAGYTNFKFVDDITKKIFEREALLGCSITGWMNNPEILLNPENLQKGATLVKATNEKVAKLIGINPAARCTTTKPSGNASVLLKTASGIHGEHSPRYLRNVQLNKDSEVAKLLMRKNSEMLEESVWSANKTDYVASFPFISQKGSKYKSELYGVKLLEFVKLVQENWVEYGTNEQYCVDKRLRHNVSNTIQVDNWDEVKEYIWDNKEIFAGISLLPLSGDKDYAQAPFTEVLTAKEISKRYGDAAFFASGMIVDGLKAFNNLWIATQTAQGFGEDISQETAETMLKRDWVRRFMKYSNNYFSGNMKESEYCLKDVYLLHKWNSIQRNLVDVDFSEALKEQQYTDIDTTGAAACSAGGCEV